MYSIEFSRPAVRQLRNLRAYERAAVAGQVEQQLTHEPTVETRNRKKLQPNDTAGWELRVGDVRVLYDVDEDGQAVVVLAIGVKDGNRLIIDGEEVEL
jgi:mRNA-degrading endonuclease RelE of RelBE toxin-antitoxin system